MSYLANCGCSHAPGDWNIPIDTGLCTGGGDCVSGCLLAASNRRGVLHTRALKTEDKS